MSKRFNIAVVSDIHYAGAAEKARGIQEIRVVENAAIRLLIQTYRRFIWLKDPMAYNHLLEVFNQRAIDADLAVANGDYSCDSLFVGVSDPAARESALECLGKLRARFGTRLEAVFGDHELGKMSLAGGRGGLRLASWDEANHALGLRPLWTRGIGRYRLVGVTSSLVALPVYEPETLAEERDEWWRLRIEHLRAIAGVFDELSQDERVILFCHDPTALPFLLREESVRSRIHQIERTIIGLSLIHI